MTIERKLARAVELMFHGSIFGLASVAARGQPVLPGQAIGRPALLRCYATLSVSRRNSPAVRLARWAANDFLIFCEQS